VASATTASSATSSSTAASSLCRLGVVRARSGSAVGSVALLAVAVNFQVVVDASTCLGETVWTWRQDSGHDGSGVGATCTTGRSWDVRDLTFEEFFVVLFRFQLDAFNCVRGVGKR
jgi:hypothetical protein